MTKRWRESPCGSTSIRHRIAHALAVQSHAECARNFSRGIAEGLAEGLLRKGSDNMALQEMPKVGDKVRYLGGEEGYVTGMTIGGEYLVGGIDWDGDAYLKTNGGMSWYISEQDFGKYELVEKESDNMAKIHVIKDESLGGVKREYVEVNRKAEVGDLVTYVYKGERDGSVSVVSKVKDDGGVKLKDSYVDDIDQDEIVGFDADAYQVLVPTDIVHIEDDSCPYKIRGRFRMVERKANVGERVIQTCPYLGNLGKVSNVTHVFGDGSGIVATNPLEHDEYCVLEPIESESPQSNDDIIANLVRRVSQLESELTGAKRDIETWAQEVEGLRNDLAGYRDDYLAIGSAVEDVDAKVEMCIDDIVTLDERTQPKDITISTDILAKLIGGVR